jgi:transcriptional regulator with XRE-family HTH domain
MNIGPMIRKHRKEKKLTLKMVAEKAEISEGFLSQVENNVNSPSVDTLIKICGAIGVNAGDILNHVESQEKLAMVRGSEWEDIEIPRSGFVTRRFFPSESRTVIDSAVMFVSPGKSIPIRKQVKSGQEILCVLKGSLTLSHGNDTVCMEKGDAVQYWVEPKKQQIVNNGPDVAVVLWVGTI